MFGHLWRKAWRAAVPLVALVGLLSCQDTTIVEEDAPPAQAGANIVRFGLPDSTAIPDSLWYQTRLDSGTTKFTIERSPLGVLVLPYLNPLGERDSVVLHTYRMGLHLGTTIAGSNGYMDWKGRRTIRTAADSAALGLLRAYDSLRKVHPADFKDTSAAAKREAFQKAVAQLVFQGHPATARYSKVAVAGLDTARIHRQVLTLAANSGLTLGEVVRRWNLALDDSAATLAFKALGLDSASLHPFRLETTLALDTLRLGEPAVGLVGKIRGKKGIALVKFTIESESGDKTDRFVLADLPDPKAHLELLDFAGHPTFQPRPGTALGQYTLRVKVSDSLSNEQTYSTAFVVAGALDHDGPGLVVVSPTGSVVRDFDDSVLVVKVEAKDGSSVQWVKIGGVVAHKATDGIWFDTLVVPISATSVSVGIQAKDGAGNTSDTVIHVRRNEPPTPTAPRLSLVSPANGTLVPFDSAGVWVEWKAQTDFGRIEAVTVDGRSANLEGDLWRLRVALNPDGKLVNLPVRAQSSVGLSVTEFVSVGRKADSAGPVVRWNAPGQDHRVAYDVKSLEVKVSVSDPSGLDSVRIGGRKPDSSGGWWMATLDLGSPGEITRIHVKAWDRLGNATDSVLLVSRDPIPGQLPPSLAWKSPEKASGTTVPFSQERFLVQVVLTDISGIDASSVEINGALAKAVNDSVWELSVDLPPNGQPQTITLVAKNKRGVAVSGFRSVARAKDEEKPTATRLAGTQDRSVVFDTSSVEVGWSAKDNDKILQAWIQDSLMISDATGYHRRVSIGLGTQWIRFRAVDPAGNEVRDSVEIERRMDTVKAVQISDTNGKLRSGSFWVKLSCATPGATIRYTLDGSEPKSTSPIYGDSLKIDTTITLKARGFAAGRVDGPVASQGFQLAVPVKVYGGYAHTLVIMSDSSLWGFGESSCNGLGFGNGCAISDQPHPKPVRMDSGVIQATSGNAQSLWLKSDGTLWAVGWNSNGSLGAGVVGTILTPTLVARGVAKVRGYETQGGSKSTLVLKSDGTLWGAGSNAAGQLGAGALSSTSQLVKIADGVSDIGGGSNFAYFQKKDGSLWGMGVFSALGLNSTTPVKVMDSIAKIPERTVKTFFVVKQNGEVLAGGENEYGQLGLGHQNSVSGLVEVSALRGMAIRSILPGQEHTLFHLVDGRVLAVGHNVFGQITGDQNLTETIVNPMEIYREVKEAGVGWSNSFVIQKNDVLIAFGGNDRGQLGGGTISVNPQKIVVKF